MYKRLNCPLVVQCEITSECNENCIHCYNYWRKDSAKTKKGSTFSMEAIDNLIDQLASHGVFHIVFTGGEPLLDKKKLFRALEKARKAGLSTGLNSNLNPLTLNDARLLKELNVTNVLTSLMAHTPELHDYIAQQTGSFSRTIQGIRFLQEVNIPLQVNMVVSKQNKDYIRDTARFVKSLGIKHFNATRAGCPGNCTDFSDMSLSINEFRNYLAELYDIREKEQIGVGVLESYPLCAIKELTKYKDFTGRRCMAGVTTITIASDGAVRPCSHLDIGYGNIFNEDLNVIWGRMQEWRNGDFLPQNCRTCKLLLQCGGGCRMEAKMQNGNIASLDPYTMPEDVEYATSELSKAAQRSLQCSHLPNAFKVNPKIRWRSENFGAVVFIGSRFKCYLNAAATDFLKSLDINRVYKLSNFAKNFGSNVEQFLIHLYNRQIFIES